MDPGRRHVGRGDMNLPSGESHRAADRAWPAVLRGALRHSLHGGVDPRRVRLSGRAAATLRRRWDAALRHAEAVVEQDEPAPRITRSGGRGSTARGCSPTSRRSTRTTPNSAPTSSPTRPTTSPTTAGAVTHSLPSGSVTAVADRPARCSLGHTGWPISTACSGGPSRDTWRVLRRTSRPRSPAGAPVPCWRGELYLEAHRGTLTSQLRTKIGNRRCERLFFELELWSAALGRPAGVDQLWREVLTQQFHDILPGSSIAWVHVDAESVFERVAAELEDRIDAVLGSLDGCDAVDRQPRLPTSRREVVVSIHAGSFPDAVRSPRRRSCWRTGDGRSSSRLPGPAWRPWWRRHPGASCRRHRSVDEQRAPRSAMGSKWGVDVGDRCRHGTRPDPSGWLAAVLRLAADRPLEYDAWDVEEWTVSGGRPIEDSSADEPVTVVDIGPARRCTRATHGASAPPPPPSRTGLRRRAAGSTSTSSSTGSTTSTC